MTPEQLADQVAVVTVDVGRWGDTEQYVDSEATSRNIAVALRDYGDLRAKEEREACAQLADEQARNYEAVVDSSTLCPEGCRQANASEEACRLLARAIRARNNP